MLNNRLTAARQVADQLFPTEHTIEDAILGSARLAISVIEGRRIARLPITTAQEGLEELIEAQRSLVEARRRMAAVHSALRKVQIDVGLGAVSFGDVIPCPDSKATGQDPALHVVAAA